MQDRILGNAQAVIRNANGTSANVLVLAGTSALFIESKDLDFGQPSKQKFVDRVVFDMEAPGTPPQFRVSLGYRDRLADDFTWTPKEQLFLPNDHITPRITARFFRIRIEDEFPITQWKLSRVEFYGQVLEGRL